MTAVDTYDDHPPNWTGPQIDPTSSDIVMRVFGNRGPNTDAELLACAAVLHANDCDDLADILGLNYRIRRGQT